MVSDKDVRVYFGEGINQYPIRFDIAIPAAGKIPTQRVVPALLACGACAVRVFGIRTSKGKTPLQFALPISVVNCLLAKYCYPMRDLPILPSSSP
jgi:hypothetical protein